jgi:acetyl-CoA carboxylase biotin carboxylase subunit
MECRIYAEDPATGFLPSPGTITRLRVPSGPWIRDDSGVYSGAEISSHYDPLISKLTVWGPDRSTALARMRRALGEYVVTGIRTNLAFHERLFQLPAFVEGKYHTGTLDEHRAVLLDGDGSLDHARDVGIALAFAVASGEAAAGADHAAAGTAAGARTGLSPWVLTHRMRSVR